MLPLQELLNEVHRLIEARRACFVLTASSARALKRNGVNLPAGRALTLFLHPLTAGELGSDFTLEHALRFGFLPATYAAPDPAAFLKSYVATYVKEEVQQEGLTRNLGAFSRFLEAASFSQACPLNVSRVARDCAVERKTVESYFTILEDLLLAVRVPAFTRRARRQTVVHPKLFLFDAGVYRAIRPSGPLDSPEEIEGAALETVVFQQLRALNDYLDLGYTIHHWRTRTGLEVDFVLYGERGLMALKVKRSRTLRTRDLAGLRAFRADYPSARALLLHGGTRPQHQHGIDILPLADGLRRLAEWMA
jgi:predicted AAA+ superfamily ATPase